MYYVIFTADAVTPLTKDELVAALNRGDYPVGEVVIVKGDVVEPMSVESVTEWTVP